MRKIAVAALILCVSTSVLILALIAASYALPGVDLRGAAFLGLAAVPVLTFVAMAIIDRRG
jgi:hypothetical protein